MSNFLTRFIDAFKSPLAPSSGGVTTDTGTAPLYRQVATYLLFDWLAGVPDPDEVLRRTGRSRKDLREILRDAEVSQALDTRREAVIATSWRLEPQTVSSAAAGGFSVQPVGDVTTGGPAVDFIAAELTPHITQLISSLWDAVPYGYSVVEAVYARRDGGRIGIASINQPPFEWFRPLPDGSLRYFPFDGTGGYHGLECDTRKFILAARNPNYRNPYGESLLSCLYWPATWRLQGWQLWLSFLDTFGAPILVGQTASYNEFVEAMQKQGITRAVGWQATSDKEKITAITASTPGEFERLEDSLNRTIQKVVLGQTLTSDVGKGGGGSLAMARVHEDVRDDKRRADLRIVSAAAQRLVDAMWGLNAFPGPAPKFCMQDDAGLERDRADRDAVLSTFGVRFSEDYIRNRYDLDQGDFTIVEPVAAPPSAPKPPGAPSVNPPYVQSAIAMSGASRFTPEQQVVEHGIAAVLPDATQPITLAQLREAITAARDERDLEERLAVLVDRQNPEYAALLARAMFACNVLGYVHASDAPAAP